jgi:hypothetical protein
MRIVLPLLVAALLGEGSAAARPIVKQMSLGGNLGWMLQRHPASGDLPRTRDGYRADLQAARRLLARPVPGSAWQQIGWEEVRGLALVRLAHPEQIAQGKRTLLCGPATALNTVARFNPLRYARLVREVYSQGSFNGLTVDSALRRLTVPIDASSASTAEGDRDNANPLDWMMLSAMRNAYGRSGFRGQKGTSLLSANLPSELRGWLQEVAGFESTRTSGGFPGLLSPRRRIAEINASFTGTPRPVILLMDMKGLRADHHTLHWMHLVAPIERTADGGVRLQVFDHGANRTYQITERLFSRRLLQTIVGSPKPPR